MNYRKLRIAWSVAWGIAAVLLLVLWVRSGSRFEGAYWMPSNQRYFDCESMRGEIRLMSCEAGPLAMNLKGWRVFSLASDSLDSSLIAPMHSHHGFGIRADAANLAICMPHWFSIFTVGFLAIVPWMRFSLSTLLIAMTLVAVGLGLIVVLF